MDAGHAGEHKRSWRERLGLQERAPEPDSWVPVASGYVDDLDSGHSELAAAVEAALKQAGIEVQLRPYVMPDQRGLSAAMFLSNTSVNDRIRVAVMVRYRDLERVKPLAEQIQHERLSWHARPEQNPFSDEELNSLGAQGISQL